MTTDETPKQMALRIVAGMPDSASDEELLYELELNFALIAGIRQGDAGDTITHEEMMKRSRRWIEELNGREKAKTTSPQPLFT